MRDYGMAMPVMKIAFCGSWMLNRFQCHMWDAKIQKSTFTSVKDDAKVLTIANFAIGFGVIERPERFATQTLSEY